MPPVKCAFCDADHEEGTRFCPKTGKALGKANRTMVMFAAPGSPLPGASPLPPAPAPAPTRRRTLTPSAPIKEVPPPPVAADRVPRPPVAPGLENSGVVRTPVTGEHSAVGGSGPRGSGARTTSGARPSGSISTPAGSGPHRSGSLPSWVVAPEAAPEGRLPTAMFPAADAPPRPALELLKDALSLYKQHAQVLVLTAAVVFVPWAILAGLLQLGLSAPGRFGFTTLLIQGLLMAVVAGLAAPLASGALTLAATDRLLGGSAGPKQYWSWLVGRLRPLLSAVVPAAILCFLGSLLFVLPGLVLGFVFLFVPMVVLVEREAGVSALKRSFQLVKSDWLRTGTLCGIFLLATLIPTIIVNQLPFALLRGTLGIVLALALLPLAGVTLLLLYLDNRRTTEGFDKEALRAQLDAVRGA